MGKRKADSHVQPLADGGWVVRRRGPDRACRQVLRCVLTADMVRCVRVGVSTDLGLASSDGCTAVGSAGVPRTLAQGPSEQEATGGR